MMRKHNTILELTAIQVSVRPAVMMAAAKLDNGRSELGVVRLYGTPHLDVQQLASL